MTTNLRTDLTLRPAQPDEATELSELALRSKGHWGYDAAFLEACRVELTYTPADCRSGLIRVAELDGQVVGFHKITGSDGLGELDACFVDPTHIGTGVGGAVIRDALDAARNRGFRRLQLDADPDAEPFYRHHGAVLIGSSPSGSIPGRVLPRLEFDLE